MIIIPSPCCAPPFVLRALLPWLLLLLSFPGLTCSCPAVPLNRATVEAYDYVALVCVEGVYPNPRLAADDPAYYHLLEVTTLRQYRGRSRDTVGVYGGHRALRLGWSSSCDLELLAGQEVVVFARGRDGGPPVTDLCTPTVVYREINGERDWLHRTGFRALALLDSLYALPPPPDFRPLDGPYVLPYPNGRPELTESYQNGQRHGYRKLFYADGTLLADQPYSHSRPEGVHRWFARDGRLLRELPHRGGLPVDTAKFYDYRGRLTHQRTFTTGGRPREEISYHTFEDRKWTETYHYGKDSTTAIYYDRDGALLSRSTFAGIRPGSFIPE